jgi:hypothetical protein
MQAKRDIANHFRSLGYTIERIAFILGYRNHSSVLPLLDNER